MTTLSHRFDFVFLFDVTNGNPNGDPDAGNLPRLDPETNQGLVTDVCLKRKIRNYTEIAKGGETGFATYVQEGAILNEKHREAYKAVRPDDPKVTKGDGKLSPEKAARFHVPKLLRCANLWRRHEHGDQLRPGPWAYATFFRALHRADSAPRNLDHPHGSHQ